MIIDFYRSTTPGTWQGRNDGSDPSVQRWHQKINTVDLSSEELKTCGPGQQGIAVIGFACDEGVRRNGGRTGAKAGPLSWRKACSNLPVHFPEETLIMDLGDIYCDTEDMETPQRELAGLVALALCKGYQPLVIGGGHELAYGHYSGINCHLENLAADKTTEAAEYKPASSQTQPANNLGIINFDAHFDLREPIARRSNSGTGFFQIAQDCQSSGRPFHYMPIGIQQNSNTKQLFDTARALKTSLVLADEFSPDRQVELRAKLAGFIAQSTHIYLTICLDVFSAAYAPGVSATAYSGLIPDPFFFGLLDSILASGKVISMDIAELNPTYDTDQRTAKLAAALSFRMISKVF